jgi:hypothetical protein
MHYLFGGKSVAIVGSAPDLIGSNMGAEIDRHDIVVRINFPRNTHDISNFGRKTDILFLGATLKEISYINDLSEKISRECKIISTMKNKKILESLTKCDFKLFFPRLLPKRITHHISCELNFNGWISSINHPPRSGFICIAAILKYGKPMKIGIFGMSRTAVSARRTLNKQGDVINYNEKDLSRCHCDPAIEIRLLEKLIDCDAGKILWYGKLNG